MKLITSDKINYHPMYITYKTPHFTYKYEILNEGIYPPPSMLAHTKPPSSYKIPNNYMVITKWGKKNNEIEVKCSINYLNQNPVFCIEFENNGSQFIESTHSSSQAANNFIK